MAKHVEKVSEPAESDLVVSDRPKDWAAGIPGVLHSMEPAVSAMGVARTGRTIMKMNQKDGFDCPSCAWPDPHHRKAFEFCENGAKAVTWEATPITVAS
jgi:formate dehydrogenase major subunit